MGTFEKLGILVIVVIIVMILAVAVYQWGGATEPVVEGDLPDPLTIRYLEDLEEPERASDGTQERVAPQDAWPGGIPKEYEIRKNDKVWILVVNNWRLKESFIAAISAANPRADMRRLLPGQILKIPDPSAYVRKAGRASRQSNARRYEIQIGDTLESIADRHLGSRLRWRDIVKLNPGLNPKRLMEGQVISIPVR